jgi:hypothetical protein
MVNIRLPPPEPAHAVRRIPGFSAENRGFRASINPLANRSNFKKNSDAFALNERKKQKRLFKPVC